MADRTKIRKTLAEYKSMYSSGSNIILSFANLQPKQKELDFLNSILNILNDLSISFSYKKTIFQVGADITIDNIVISICCAKCCTGMSNCEAMFMTYGSNIEAPSDVNDDGIKRYLSSQEVIDDIIFVKNQLDN